MLALPLAPQLAATAVGAYLIGSIPTAFLVVKKVTGKDIRDIGSGNVGATNTARAVGKKLGAMVLVLDAIKGALPVLLAGLLFPGEHARLLQAIAGGMAIVGHMFPVWLGFAGGKGVASTLGVFFTLEPWCMLIASLAALLAINATKWVALGSLVIAWGLPAIIVGRQLQAGVGAHLTPSLVLALILALVITVRHRGNIGRMLKGTERKLGERAEAPQSPLESGAPAAAPPNG